MNRLEFIVLQIKMTRLTSIPYFKKINKKLIVIVWEISLTWNPCHDAVFFKKKIGSMCCTENMKTAAKSLGSANFIALCNCRIFSLPMEMPNVA